MPTVEKRHELIDLIRRLPDDLQSLIGGLSEQQLTTPYLPNEWTIAQNVHHLADAHMNAFFRFKRILLESNPTIDPFDQDAWASTPEASDAEIQASISILRGLHFRWANLMEALDETLWLRPAIHRQVGPVVLYDVLDSYSRHCQNHLAQIQSVLDAMAEQEG